MSAPFEIFVNLLKLARRPVYLAIYTPWYGLYQCQIQEHTEGKELLRIDEIDADSLNNTCDFRFPIQEDIDNEQEVTTSAKNVELRAYDNILGRLAWLIFKTEYKKLLYNCANLKKFSDFQLKIAAAELITEPTSQNPLCKYTVQPSEDNFLRFIDQQMSFMTFLYSLYSQCNDLTSEISMVFGKESSVEHTAKKTKSKGFISHIPGFHIVSCSSWDDASSDDVWWGDDPSVVVLEDDNFTKRLYKEKVLLVMFYAPWCNACWNMKPIFIEAARELQSEGWECCVAIVDCSVNFDIPYKYGVEAFPSIKIFQNGRFMQNYLGGKSKEELKKFAIKFSRKKE